MHTYRELLCDYIVMNHCFPLSVPTDEPTKEMLYHIIASNAIQISQLSAEVNSLRQRNTELEKDKETYRDSMEKYKEIVEQNKKIIKEHEISLDKLKEENIILKNKIEEQNNKITQQNLRINSLENHIAELKNDITELKNRDEPITIREGFISLEKFIMLEISGSKKKARSFHGVKDLFSKKEYKIECDNFLTKYNITIDHINLISDIKDYENQSTHANRPQINKNDFENIALSYFTDDDDKIIIKDLLIYLEQKNPHDKITGLWNIIKPY